MKKTILALALLSVSALARPMHPNWPPQDYAICYGKWRPEMVQQAHKFGLLVMHPGDDFSNITPALVDQIKAGRDGKVGTADDVIVLGYVSIGEDDQVPAGPPQPGDGPTVSINKTLKTEKTGYPTRYLDQISYVFQTNGERSYGEDGKPLTVAGQDGVPDENGVWGSYYVDAGDPQWQSLVLARMGRLQDEFHVDGFFLDTLDTASPWGNYHFSHKRMAALLQLIRKSYPQRLILANRGMFLLESDTQAYVSSIDGLLYESLYCVWDWGAKRGVISPWAAGDVNYLNNPVLPAAKKHDIHMFYINYLNPAQPDFYPLLHAVEDVVGRQGISNYVSDPLLQELGQPLAQIFPEQGEKPPQLTDLKIEQSGQGRFQIKYQVDDPQQRLLGKDLFLDIRLGRDKGEIALLPTVPVAYDQPGLVEGLGLEQATTYSLYARVVGKSRSCRTPYKELSFTTPAALVPAQVQDLSSMALESSVRLKWKDSGAREYKIYQGNTPWQLSLISSSTNPTCLVTGLQNGQPLYFAVSAVNDAGEGNLCRPLLAQAQDCTPPASPLEVVIDAQGSLLHISWTAVTGAGSYRIYCLDQAEKYRIPLRTSETSITLPALKPGKYKLWVTSVDDAGNESRRNQVIEARIDK